jgi:hypothetical protein
LSEGYCSGHLTSSIPKRGYDPGQQNPDPVLLKTTEAEREAFEKLCR